MPRLRISDAPLLNSVIGDVKIPTGKYGDYTLTPDMLVEYAQGKLPFATKTELAQVKAQLETSINTVQTTLSAEISTLSTKVDSMESQVLGVSQDLTLHKSDVSNPHKVTKAQVGLGNVDNTSDLNKPISTATQSALNQKISSVNGKTGNSITLTRDDVGVPTDDQIKSFTKEAKYVIDESGLTQQDINKSTIRFCETTLDLKDVFPYGSDDLVLVKKYGSTSPNYGGVKYKWDETSTDDVDDIFVISSNKKPIGRWKAVFDNNVINAWNVGYIGDGVTSNHLVHAKVSNFLNSSNESWELLFTDGSFMFNHKHNRFWLVSNVKYNVTGTAIIKGGIAFDDDIVWFSSQYDTTKPLENTSIVGDGVFDMSETGLQKTSYKVRVVFYILNPVNLLVDGLTFTGGDFTQTLVIGETEHATTSRDVLIKNCNFDMQVSSDVTSKNYDFTCVYTQARNTVIRNNTFYTSNIRARCISTAVEFHTKDCRLDSNIINDLAVGVYIAPQEQQNTSNIQVLNNTGRLSNLFVSFWANSGLDREISDIYISGNNIKQNLYPDAATLAANGLIVKTEGLRFFSFIHTDGFSATNKFSSSGIFITNNTFTHIDTNDQCCLLYLFCNPPENIHFSNNALNISSFIGSSGTVTNGLKNIFITDNTIDSRYLSGTIAPFSLNATSLTNCLFDMSDIRYFTVDAKTIPMFSFTSGSMNITLSTIIEGRDSWNMYARSTYPISLYSNANVNNVGIVYKGSLVIPSGVNGALPVYSDTSSFNRFTNAEIIYSGEHIDANLSIPDTLKKRSGDSSAFVGVGYTSPALSENKVSDVWLYIS